MAHALKLCRSYHVAPPHRLHPWQCLLLFLLIIPTIFVFVESLYP
ncbi:hypothetical protein CLV36_101490 [Laceyella sediminis]|uniref:Uncharacterized protein n=1 Tax=Laceyella sediminis TaxID=573074 RepID=A0ABX5EWJ5_9BACL|nr:hypothetical protein CLV36_101490 [Laceyella sediminis]